MADFYSWGAVGHANKGAHGIRALGVKTVPCTAASCANPDSKIVTFAVNTFRPNSQYASDAIEYDVDITLAGNTTGKPDFTLFTVDAGLASGGAASGSVLTILVNNKTGDAIGEFIATASKTEFKASTWFTMEVIARGNHFTVKIDGKTVAEYTDGKATYKKGRIALETYLPGTAIAFKPSFQPSKYACFSRSPFR